MLLPLLMNNLLSDGSAVAAPEAESQTVVGVGEMTIAHGVPCFIRSKRVFREDPLLGYRPVEIIQCWMGVDPKLEVGYVLVASGPRGTTRYIVQQVDDRPSPHAPQFQVAELRVDESSD